MDSDQRFRLERTTDSNPRPPPWQGDAFGPPSRLLVAGSARTAQSKSPSRHTFVNALTDGAAITMAPFFFDTANAIALNPFTPGGGFDIPELGGSPNVIMVPDPTTFTLLPWAERTGWALADLAMRDGTPFPFSPRTLLRERGLRAVPSALPLWVIRN
jgi:hypothetical protein